MFNIIGQLWRWAWMIPQIIFIGLFLLVLLVGEGPEETKETMRQLELI